MPETFFALAIATGWHEQNRGKTMALIVTAVTESGPKLEVLLKVHNSGPRRYAFDPNSPGDAVRRLLNLAKSKNELLERLSFIGHGTPKGQQIGGHFVTDDNVQNYQADWAKLPQIITGEGVIHLRGCNVGQNENLLKALARMTSCPVYAGTAFEHGLAPLNTGQIVRAMPGGSIEKGVKRPDI